VVNRNTPNGLPVREARAIAWTGGAFAVAAVLAGLMLLAFGAGERGVTLALRATARFAFLLFLPAYVGGALARLAGSRFAWLARRGRALGLAFAAAMVVHAGLVAWLCWIGAAPSRGVFVLFGSALACVAVLAVFSAPRLQQALGPRTWWRLRLLGMNYIAFAFAVDFLRHSPFGGVGHTVGYLPFALLSLAGPACYWLALALRRGGPRRARDPSGPGRSIAAGGPTST
jgi:hypothetical protein